MAYTDVPVDLNETFSVSQPKIKTNFSLINTVFAIDHEEFNDPNKGRHKHVSFNVQADHPLTSTTDVKLYCKNNSSGVPTLWVKKADKAAGLAGVDILDADKRMPGYCWLPCGIKMIWGTATIDAGHQSVTTTFLDTGGASIKFPNNVLTVMVVKTNLVTPADGDDSIILVTSKSDIAATFSRPVPAHVGTAAVVEYLAIGY